MHIVHVIDHLGAGGAQRLLADLAPRQQRRGHGVHIVCLRGSTALGQTLKAKGTPVTYLRLKRSDPRQAWALYTFLRNTKPDIVHTHLTLSCFLGRIAAVMAGISAVIVHDHEADAEIFITPAPILALKRLAEPRLPPRALRYVVVSRSAQSYAREVRRLPESQIVLVPNGVDVDHLEHKRLAPDAARQHMNVPVDVPLIGFAGRMAREKGIDLLLDALAHLPHAHAAIAGTGPLADAMRSRARTLGIHQRAHFVGYLDDIRPLLWACDVYVQPSRREAFGLAAAEAAALGLPVVAFRTGGLQDVVLDGMTGLLARPGDAQDLAAALNTLLSDVKLAQALGDAGRQYVRAHFAIDAVLDSIDKVYQEVIDHSEMLCHIMTSGAKNE